MAQHGFTLLEVLLGTALLVGGGGALLIGMNSAMINAGYLQQMQLAMNATEGKLEELAATDFETLIVGGTFTQARQSAGQCAGLNEDANCNGTLDAGEDTNGSGTLDEPIPGAHLTIQIVPADPINPTAPGLLKLHVAASWVSRGRRIGEDQNGNGRLDLGEDANGDTWISSPVMSSTAVARRE